MGDILHALPAITALRRMHPAWKIDWAIEPRWLPLLSAEPESAAPDVGRNAARPVVDRAYLVPARDWGRRLFAADTRNGIRALRNALRAGQYDAVLDMQGSFKSAVVARLSGCRRLIGEATPRELPARWLFTEHVETAGEHVVDQGVELANSVCGDLLEPTLPDLPIDPEAEAWCDQLTEIRTWKPVVLVHPGGGWGAKRWPAERYGAVVEELAQRGAVVLVNAGPGEEFLAASVVTAANGHGSVMVTSLEQLIALTRRASLVIGGDTGPLHLASALGKPVVGIYGPTDPKRNGPYGGPFRVLRNPESRRDHTRREPPEAGLLTILPESVMEAAMELMLEERQGQGSKEHSRSGPIREGEHG